MITIDSARVALLENLEVDINELRADDSPLAKQIVKLAGRCARKRALLSDEIEYLSETIAATLRDIEVGRDLSLSDGRLRQVGDRLTEINLYEDMLSDLVTAYTASVEV